MSNRSPPKINNGIYNILTQKPTVTNNNMILKGSNKNLANHVGIYHYNGINTQNSSNGNNLKKTNNLPNLRNGSNSPRV